MVILLIKRIPTNQVDQELERSAQRKADRETSDKKREERVKESRLEKERIRNEIQQARLSLTKKPLVWRNDTAQVKKENPKSCNLIKQIDTGSETLSSSASLCGDGGPVDDILAATTTPIIDKTQEYIRSIVAKPECIFPTYFTPQFRRPIHSAPTAFGKR